MSYIGKNPKFNSTVFTDIGNGAVDNPASGSHRLVNRNGGLVLRDSTGVEISAGGGSTAIKITQTAHGYVVGDVLYFDGANYLKAIASAANTSEVVGVVSKIINANSFELTTAGQVTDLAGLTAGTVYFLSPTVAGAWTDTEPSTLGQISSPLGVASDTTKLIVAIKRGIVVGGTNARAVVSLANNATTTIQNVSTYDAGELTGWVSIAATTPLKFYVSAPFAKNGAGTDYNISPSYLGDTPPVGFSVTVTSGGLIQATLPSVAGFTAASINYALNAPAVGATFPLSVDAATIATGQVAAARLPVASNIADGIVSTLSQVFSGQKTFTNDVISSRFSTSNQYINVGGSVNVLNLNSGESWLLFSVPVNYGGADNRHGILAIASRQSNSSLTYVNQIIAMTATGAFSVSGTSILYAAGGGVPDTYIWKLRIA